MTGASAVTRLFSETVFELPLSPTYCARWGLAEAARELLQNAIDSDSPFEYELTDTRLSVVSRHSTLDASSLLLGTTTKAEREDAIGSFGEGYKIALLVLTREGYHVTVRNGDVTWRPEFRRNKKYGADILCIVQAPAEEPRRGLEFVIEDLREGDAERIRAGCLRMQEDLGEAIEAQQGRILPQRAGKLYVGGLFVCETKLKYGYDVKPEHLRLERDRQTVSSFDLQWLTKEMWFSAKRWDEVARMVEAGVPDLEYAQHGTPELVKEACYRLFVEKNPGKLAARSQDQLNSMVREGLREVVVVREAFHDIVTSTRPYRERPQVRVKTPAEHLRGWLKTHKFHIHADARKSMETLVERAEKSWRVT